MTSRQTAVPAREPARGSGAREPDPGSGAGDSPPGPARQPALGGELHGPALARLLLTALLIAAVLVGLRGGFTLHGWRGPYRRDAIAIGIALEAVLAALLITLLIRGRHPSDDFRVGRLRGVLRYALIAALLVFPTILLLAKPLHGHPLPLPRQPQPTPPTGATPAVTRAPRPAPAFHVPLTGILYALLVLVLIAGIVICVMLLRRHQPSHDAEPPEASVAEGQRGDLQDAVSSGRRALASLDDTRAAIIACYVAMERSLAAAGADQEAADTPDEFLGRAVAAGLVRGRAAGVLARLFYEARFSAHELTPAQRDAAQEALEQLAADLRGSS
jgi:Domain of unknown function (DUF4129)